MKRPLRVGVLVILIGLGLVAFRFSPAKVKLRLPHAPELMARSVQGDEFKDAARTHFDIDLTKSAGEFSLDGNLQPRLSRTKFEFKGKGLLRLNRKTYGFLPQGQQWLGKKTLSTGRQVIYGTLEGQMETLQGLQDASMMIGYEPETGHGQASVTVGNMGGDVVLYFGQEFLTRNELKELLHPGEGGGQ